jgi:hypothetical protein
VAANEVVVDLFDAAVLFGRQGSHVSDLQIAVDLTWIRGQNVAEILTGGTGSMRHLDFFLVCSVTLSVVCCGRTSLDTAVVGTGNTLSLGGAAAYGGAPAAGGATGIGESTSAADGSVSTTDLDTCASDADCTSCDWGKAPTDSSQCTGTYCCGGPISSKKRCEASQAAWALYCPNQLPKPIDCPCVGLGCTGEYVGCNGGQCGLWCPPPVDAGA